MDTTILFLLGLAVGWVVGSWFTAIKQALAFKDILKDLGVTTEQLTKLKDRMDLEEEEESQTPARETVVEVKLEQHSGIIYAYRKDNDQFLAQGNDRDKLIEHLNHTFAQGARLIIREEDGAALVKP